jgi:hypothetical protein
VHAIIYIFMYLNPEHLFFYIYISIYTHIYWYC